MKTKKSKFLWAVANNIGILSCTDKSVGNEFTPLFPTKKDANKFLSYSKVEVEFKLIKVIISKYENHRVKKQQHKTPKGR